MIATSRPWLTYARVSTSDQARDGCSMEVQRDATSAMLKALGHQRGESIEDAGWSGKDLDRPGMKRLLAMVEGGEIAGVAIYKLDRITRSVEDLYRLLRLFQDHGVALVAVRDMIDTSTTAGRMMIGFLGVIAQWYRENVSDLVTAGMRHRKAQGGFTGGRPPAGLRAEGETGKRVLVRDEPHATAVAEVWPRIVSGTSLSQLRDWLTEQGVPCQSKHWTTTGVHKIARNPRYIGHLTTEGTFNQAGFILAGRPAPGKKSNRSAMMSRDQTHAIRVWPLTGIARCASCDSAMIGVHGHNASGVAFPYYRCTGRVRKGRTFCSAKDLPAEVWESLVVKTLIQAVEDNMGLLAAVEKVGAELQAKAKPMNDELAALTMQRDAARQKVANLVAMVADGGAAGRGVARYLGEAQEALEAMESQIATLEGTLRATAMGQESATALVEAMQNHLSDLATADPEQQAATLKEFLASVRMRPPAKVQEEGEIDLAINLPRLSASSFASDTMVGRSDHRTNLTVRCVRRLKVPSTRDFRLGLE